MVFFSPRSKSYIQNSIVLENFSLILLSTKPFFFLKRGTPATFIKFLRISYHFCISKTNILEFSSERLFRLDPLYICLLFLTSSKGCRMIFSLLRCVSIWVVSGVVFELCTYKIWYKQRYVRKYCSKNIVFELR